MFRQLFYNFISVFLVCCLLIPVRHAGADNFLGLPEPGKMITLSPAFSPVCIKGLKINPADPFAFDFIIDKGSEPLKIPLETEVAKLVKYFLTALTIPEQDLWVNLSPYEKDRMIALNLGQTEMGRDMLAQDYVLKQLTASLIYPEGGPGRIFWEKVYSKARQLYGTTDIPFDTFNKVWIVADQADVVERDNSAYVVRAHLKVMVAEDYAALNNNARSVEGGDEQKLDSGIAREIIIPELEKEVNEGRNFALLRQAFYSMILASWYKMTLKDTVLSQIYGDKSKVMVGVNQSDPKANEAIFNRYLLAFRTGVFNYIKEEPDQDSGEMIPRKYFAGGEDIWQSTRVKVDYNADAAMQVSFENMLVASVSTFPVMKRLSGDSAADQYRAMPPVRVVKDDRLDIVRTLYRVVGNGTKKVRVSHLIDMPLTPREQKDVIDRIKKYPSLPVVAITAETLGRAVKGDVELVLNDTLGIIPRNLLKKKVILSGNAKELLNDTASDSLNEGIKGLARIQVRVGAFFRMWVERKGVVYYVLELGSDNSLKPFGGAVQFDGESVRKAVSTMFPSMTTIPGENPLDIRLDNIPGARLDDFLEWFSSGLHREGLLAAGRREGEEEFVGKNSDARLFDQWPVQWLALMDAAEVAGSQGPSGWMPRPEDILVIPGGIDLNSAHMNMDIKTPGKKAPLPVDLDLIKRFEAGGFDGLQFKIRSIVPAADQQMF
jgi:hypothetical protein